MECKDFSTVSKNYTFFTSQILKNYNKLYSPIFRCFGIEKETSKLQKELLGTKNILSGSSNSSGTGSNGSGSLYNFPNFIIIPNQDENYTNFYMDTLVQDLSSEILSHFEKIASNPKAFLFDTNVNFFFFFKFKKLNFFFFFFF
jgi:hypothetical protein